MIVNEMNEDEKIGKWRYWMVQFETETESEIHTLCN